MKTETKKEIWEMGYQFVFGLIFFLSIILMSLNYVTRVYPISVGVFGLVVVWFRVVGNDE